MYSVAIIGNNLAAQLQRSHVTPAASMMLSATGMRMILFPQPAVYSLGANASRLLRALAPTLLRYRFLPDRFKSGSQKAPICSRSFRLETFTTSATAAR